MGYNDNLGITDTDTLLEDCFKMKKIAICLILLLIVVGCGDAPDLTSERGSAYFFGAPVKSEPAVINSITPINSNKFKKN